MTPPILVKHDGYVLRITFNRPERLNAFTTGMLTLAAEAVEAAGEDPGVRAVVLAGAGRAFSAGADLAGGETGELPGTDTIDAANRLILALRRTPQPVLAAVGGPAVGVGCSVALAADVTVAQESAYFLLAFADVGLMPDGGATLLVPAAVGRARAVRMALLTERVPAALAADWGLITHVVPDDAFDNEVERLTRRLAHGPTQAFARTKHALNASSLPRLEDTLAVERRGQAQLFTTADFAEGVTSFREKRRPEFSGK
ncbi:enoyl-CoA hydratase [Streptomyces leeuwenhoekii]|uniref:Probable enoyl-CoA hydratase paaG n=1 Tax=Streptomyces leeuwenhoekii TaxID=1437453 RepID=A0A0F7W0R1_STRLW|nr:enoyl-CoA hydratase [Streptomyces leeuwenhoekii]CQR65580.1 Probable enoyl-CoA hydratase paaG [Streptomyces leeuwenhoekii]